MRSTLVSTILNRMDRYRTISKIEEQYKVRDLDEAIRAFRRENSMPWLLQKSSLKVFEGVLEYPVATDHDELAYLDTTKDTFYQQKARYRYTNLKQFYEDPTNRNSIAEIFDGNSRYLGIRNKFIGQGSIRLDNAETVGNYAVSGDADSVALDNVIYKEGNGSMKIVITNSTDIANIVTTYSTAINDSKYKQKYYFRWIYLDAVPTSIDLRLRTDVSNYLSKNITTQFSGQAFKADQWNLIAMDLNEATENGTFDSSSIASDKIILNGASTGTYYLDACYLRQWELQDYWYYSINSIATTGSSIADQEYIFNSSDVYSTDSSIVGDSEWIDVIMFDAILTGLADEENETVFPKMLRKRVRAWEQLIAKYPTLVPLITIKRKRFLGVDKAMFPNNSISN